MERQPVLLRVHIMNTLYLVQREHIMKGWNLRRTGYLAKIMSRKYVVSFFNVTSSLFINFMFEIYKYMFHRSSIVKGSNIIFFLNFLT